MQVIFPVKLPILTTLAVPALLRKFIEAINYSQRTCHSVVELAIA